MSDILLFIWGAIITVFVGSAVAIVARAAYYEKEVEGGRSPDFPPGHPQERPAPVRAAGASASAEPEGAPRP